MLHIPPILYYLTTIRNVCLIPSNVSLHYKVMFIITRSHIASMLHPRTLDAPAIAGFLLVNKFQTEKISQLPKCQTKSQITGPHAQCGLAVYQCSSGLHGMTVILARLVCYWVSRSLTM